MITQTIFQMPLTPNEQQVAILSGAHIGVPATSETMRLLKGCFLITLPDDCDTLKFSQLSSDAVLAAKNEIGSATRYFSLLKARSSLMRKLREAAKVSKPIPGSEGGRDFKLVKNPEGGYASYFEGGDYCLINRLGKAWQIDLFNYTGVWLKYYEADSLRDARILVAGLKSMRENLAQAKAEVEAKSLVKP